MTYCNIIRFNGIPAWPTILGCLLLYAGTVQSSGEQWYKMEIIVFEQKSLSNEEFGPNDLAVDWPKDLVELNKTIVQLEALPADVVPYAMLSSADSSLSDLFRKLKRSDDYVPVLQLAWIQSVFKNRAGKAAFINGNGVAGYVRLQRGNYLHLVIDVNYSKTSGSYAPEFENGSGEAIGAFNNGSEVEYHLKERRRILLKQTHYFDHPTFGVIAKVTPLEIDAVDPAEE